MSTFDPTTVSTETHLVVGILTPSEAHRFFSKICINFISGCWEWQGCLMGKGYSQLHFRGRYEMTHRLSFAMARFPIPRGLGKGIPQIDHLCKNTRCVNPDHLELVSGTVNNSRSVSVTALNAIKTHCPQGHEYTTENTYYDKKGRLCRECMYARNASEARREYMKNYRIEYLKRQGVKERRSDLAKKRRKDSKSIAA